MVSDERLVELLADAAMLHVDITAYEQTVRYAQIELKKRHAQLHDIEREIHAERRRV